MNGVLDLWAREHYKSTLTTFAGSLFRIIRSHGDDAPDPTEVTIGIFSHTRSIAKGFLRQIKAELENNEHLQMVFDDVFWANPRKEAAKWTEDEGITVKRKSNPKEATVEAHGLVDGQPTSKHYRHRQYDDVVTLESVTSPDMIAKTTQAYEMSDNLGTEGGTFAVAGTRYHFADTYGAMIKRGMPARIYPCTFDGTENFTADNCVLMQPKTLIDKRRTQGPYTFGTQMLLNPKGDASQTFRSEWLHFVLSEPTREGLNTYILCDPANSKRKGSDFTTFWVVGLGPDRNYLLLDLIRDRLNLTERTQTLLDLHRAWRPEAVGYEQYGMQADISHILTVQEQQNYRFHIHELGGQTPKPDRIRRLIPLFEQSRVYCRRTRMHTDYEGKTINLIDVFVEEEYKAFPVMAHDDMLDCLARIEDPEFKAILRWPMSRDTPPPRVIVNTNRHMVQLKPVKPGQHSPNVITRR
jgi:phage terminase large subunit-like protein